MPDFARIWTRNLWNLARRAEGHALWVSSFQKLTACSDEEAAKMIEERLAQDRQDYALGKRKGRGAAPQN